MRLEQNVAYLSEGFKTLIVCLSAVCEKIDTPDVESELEYEPVLPMLRAAMFNLKIRFPQIGGQSDTPMDVEGVNDSQEDLPQGGTERPSELGYDLK